MLGGAYADRVRNNPPSIVEPVVNGTRIVTDAAYFMRRAEQEVVAAQCASHPAAVAAHYRLSQAYLDLVYPRSSRPVASRR